MFKVDELPQGVTRSDVPLFEELGSNSRCIAMVTPSCRCLNPKLADSLGRVWCGVHDPVKRAERRRAREASREATAAAKTSKASAKREAREDLEHKGRAWDLMVGRGQFTRSLDLAWQATK